MKPEPGLSLAQIAGHDEAPCNLLAIQQWMSSCTSGTFISGTGLRRPCKQACMILRLDPNWPRTACRCEDDRAEKPTLQDWHYPEQAQHHHINQTTKDNGNQHNHNTISMYLLCCVITPALIRLVIADLHASAAFPLWGSCCRLWGRGCLSPCQPLFSSPLNIIQSALEKVSARYPASC